MLFRQLGAILGGGLAIVAAGPLSHSIRDVPGRPDAVVRRDIPASHALHERQPLFWTQKWKRGAKVPRNALLPMRVGLKQRNLDEGAELLRDMCVVDSCSSSVVEMVLADSSICIDPIRGHPNLASTCPRTR